jgi:hypothetical protein
MAFEKLAQGENVARRSSGALTPIARRPRDGGHFSQNGKSDMKFQKSPPKSEARIHLASLIDARKEAIAKRDAAAARINHLGRPADAVAPLCGRLAALDSQETKAFADWTLDPTKPVPAVDAEGRAALVSEIVAAEAASAAARRAQDALQSEVAAAQLTVSAVESELAFAVHVVALEEADSLEARAKELTAEFDAIRTKVGVFLDALDAVRIGKQSSEAGWAEFTSAYVDAQDRLIAAFNAPAPDEAAKAEFAGKVRAVLGDLREDAGSRLHFEARK